MSRATGAGGSSDRRSPQLWPQWAAGQLDAVREAGLWRQPRSFDASGPAGLLGGRRVVSFASNDYLGLTTHPTVVAAAHAAIDRWGTGSGASRLIVGSRPCHHELEDELAAWKSTDRALVFPTGYAANLGVLGVVGGPDVTVYSDELNHASIVDGCRLSRAAVTVYRHNDVEHLASLMAHAPSGQRSVVVTDTVFSMDGDLVRLDELAELCARRGALLVLDEAHAVLGPHDVPDVDGLTALRVGTLSKALGALGGFIAGPGDFIDLLVNRARSFIFTTAPSPADVAAALAATRVVRSDEGGRLRRRLRDNIDRVAPGHPSPIVPIVLGEEAAALDAAARLLDRGVFVPAIRPPTVPPGSSRLRVTISAAHTDEMLDLLTAGLSDIRDV